MAVVDKSDLPLWLTNKSGTLFAMELIVRLTLRASELDIANDVLVIDEAMPEFRRILRVRLSEECRRTGRVRPFRIIVGGGSAHEDGLQLADMIAGAARHFVIGDARDHYQTFANKVVDLWQVKGNEK